MSLYIFINMVVCYILQEREFIKSGERIYKIGETGRTMKQRMEGYPKGSIVLVSYKVADSRYVESLIFAKFKEKFEQQNENIGKEYFKGDINDMIDLFHKICSKNKNKKTYNNITLPETTTKQINVNNDNTLLPTTITKQININIDSTIPSNTITNQISMKNNDIIIQATSINQTSPNNNDIAIPENILTTTTQNKYHCEPCAKSFTQKSHYVSHQNSSTCKLNENKMYNCSHCNFVSHTKNGLTFHLKKCNSDNKTSELLSIDPNKTTNIIPNMNNIGIDVMTQLEKYKTIVEEREKFKRELESERESFKKELEKVIDKKDREKIEDRERLQRELEKVQKEKMILFHKLDELTNKASTKHH